SNWAALMRYTEHGDLSIDNNLAERMLRAQAIGRKNYTFLGSDRGGRTAAVLYSFTGTCKHHDIDPFAYLQDILRRLPSHPADLLDELLPDVWFASHPSARRKTAAGIGKRRFLSRQSLLRLKIIPFPRRQGRREPGAGVGPFAEGGGAGDAQGLGRFVDRQPGEKVEAGDISRGGILGGKTCQGRV